MTKTNTKSKSKIRRIVTAVAVGSVALAASTMGFLTSPGREPGGGSGRNVAASNVEKTRETSQQAHVKNYAAMRKAGNVQHEY